ncbi:MAG: SDR family NAD(P)-dependent oxidoreductase [Candidatus Binatia bacterium]|nr:SDR family NAD(P)-dependent oxidoreductase [Candidatus Binatia bacterium]
MAGSIRLSDRVAVVTGASRGIGKALAVGLAAAGAKVVCAARSRDEAPNPEGLPGTIEETVRSIGQNGGTAIAVRCDIGVERDIEKLVAETLSAFGRLDILLNNAMTPTRGAFDAMTGDEWDRSMLVNVRSLYVSCRAVLPTMRAQEAGSIINMSSGAADPFVEGMPPGFLTYSVAKAALERFSTALALELAPDGIAVNALRPGAVKTEKSERELGADFDWTGWAAPESVLPATLFLAAQDGSGFTGKIVDATEFGTAWP